MAEKKLTVTGHILESISEMAECGEACGGMDVFFSAGKPILSRLSTLERAESAELA